MTSNKQFMLCKVSRDFMEGLEDLLDDGVIQVQCHLYINVSLFVIDECSRTAVQDASPAAGRRLACSSYSGAASLRLVLTVVSILSQLASSMHTRTIAELICGKQAQLLLSEAGKSAIGLNGLKIDSKS